MVNSWPQRAEVENILSVCTPRSLTNVDTGMGTPDPSEKKRQSQGASLPNGEVVAFGRIDRKIPFLRPVNAAVIEL